MQQLFSLHRGSHTLPVTTVKGDFDPPWWVATATEGDEKVYFQVINSGNATIPLTLDLDRAFDSVNGTIIVSLVRRHCLTSADQNGQYCLASSSCSPPLNPQSL